MADSTEVLLYGAHLGGTGSTLFSKDENTNTDGQEKPASASMLRLFLEKALQSSTPSNMLGSGGEGGIKYYLQLYLFPIAAVTNGHTCSGLKQYKFIILQFW